MSGVFADQKHIRGLEYAERYRLVVSPSVSEGVMSQMALDIHQGVLEAMAQIADLYNE
jgi:hypothetical protein